MLAYKLLKTIPKAVPVFKFTSGYGYKNPHAGENKIYAPSINEKSIWLNIVNNGRFERICAYEGESLLKALQNFAVDGVPAICEGGEFINAMTEKPIDPLTQGPFCNQCHVIIADPWRQKMGSIHFLEERNLEESISQITPNSRLACCLVVEKWMNEMIVTIGENYGETDDIYA